MADRATARHARKRCADCGRVLPAEAFYRRPGGYLSAYCKAHQLERGRASRQRNRQPGQAQRAPAKGADNHRLPAAPLLAAVRRLAERRNLSLRELLGPDLFGAFGNALQAGTVRLIVLERFCDEVLGWHPRMLYGDAYDRAAHSTNGSKQRTPMTKGGTHDARAHPAAPVSPAGPDPLRARG